MTKLVRAAIKRNFVEPMSQVFRSKSQAYYLPPSLLEESSRRLGYATLALGCLVGLGALGEFIYSHVSRRPLDLWLETPPMIFLLALSAFVYLLTKENREGQCRISSRQAIQLGRFYLFVVCFVLSYSFWMPFQGVFEWTPTSTDMGAWKASGPSWVAIAVLCFTLILPATPRGTLCTAVAATTTSPIALVVASCLYVTQPPPTELLVFFLLQYVVCLMAWALSFVFVRLVSRLDAQSKVGAYKLIELLREGGMGQVWKARHALLARDAAVKIIRSELLSENPVRLAEAISSFQREARITASLTSPHTVALFDYGQTEEGRLYSVTELLEGSDLGRVMDTYGYLSVARSIHILTQACRSLEEAHAAGLVHRDIKPGNLFLCRAGLEYDFVKVLDFGLVSFSSTASLGDNSPQDLCLFHGTIDYISPEQIQGEEVSAKSDLYSLGCVAYYMLTGEQVFEGNPVMVLAGHLTRRPEPMNCRAPQDVPERLESLIFQCLSKKSEDRPASAAEMRRTLEALQADFPWTEEDARAFWNYHSRSQRGYDPDLAGAVLSHSKA